MRRADVTRAAVLTDGAACIVHPYEVMGWGEVLDLMGEAGPQALIDRVRQAERGDPECVRWPRYKPGDDATAVWCGLPG
ncbi:hypothetical protein [Streptosporangium sp. CA-115845]|uniref:hypothetical protein n=1 Tax=Streptosporangium sp. CA-115845 TaxID=3240071 RepID=UPI003D94A115